LKAEVGWAGVLMESAELSLNVFSKELKQTELQELVYELSDDLGKQRGVNATLKSEQSAEGKKGDPVAIGDIVLRLIAGGGVATSLIGVLRAYVQRVPTLELDFQGKNRRLKLRAKNFNADTLDATRKQMEEFFRDE
jgi:hypothetical protein